MESNNIHTGLSEIGDAHAAQLLVYGVVFNLEHETGRIYPQYNPDNAISFKGEKPVDGYYHAIYDRAKQAIYKGDIQDHFLQINVKFPEILFKGPIKENNVLTEINQESFEDNAGFVIVNNTIKNRLAGLLPQVDIMGDKYILDLTLNQLWSISDDKHILSIEKFRENNDKVYAWYDKANKKVVDIDARGILSTPKNIYLVELPSWFRIDPVSPVWRKQFEGTRLHEKETMFLNTVMMEPNPTANATHISQTEMVNAIKMNRIRKGLPPERIRKTPKWTKGKKL
ncbi:hypothetical protein [[Flexibacter] sp. ATCC 35208]|uniref:hypothetical protein n=1 Tax=[Flexibacter] sp. ATCC 35208 TaxID=1936242 RepID=UPI0009CE92E4|nr:hypothetical protein [[Flexibacter] sp. ATCC 35208]OMP80042.1 hypothetical protein BW716_05995 [[Flexibacter] sp. ATCC 35208]